MVIDKESFTDLALTLKAMSDVVLLMAKQCSVDPEGMQSFRPLLSELNSHVGTAQGIMHAVNEENHIMSRPSGTTGRA
jgi:hypothetical protein